MCPVHACCYRYTGPVSESSEWARDAGVGSFALNLKGCNCVT